EMTGSQLAQMNASRLIRRLPAGAEIQPSGGVHFRVWAPKCRRVAVHISDEEGHARPPLELSSERDGYFGGFSPDATAGDRYRCLLDDDPHGLPDPASRFQP